MVDLSYYPVRCRKNIRKLSMMLSADPDIVFSMMKMTALLMDLDLDDDMIVSTILLDCGIKDALEGECA